MDTSTGEMMSVQLVSEDSYDWNDGGRHANAAKRTLAKFWHAKSGYTDTDKMVLGHFAWNAKPGDGPLRETQKDIAEAVGKSPSTVSTALKRLARGNFLIPTEKVGRVTFYRPNPRVLYDGSARRQNRAVAGMPHPIIPYPKEKKA